MANTAWSAVATALQRGIPTVRTSRCAGFRYAGGWLGGVQSSAVDPFQRCESLIVPHGFGELVIDDRLTTVLSTKVGGAGGLRIQYRQLLDLLGRMPPDFVLPTPALARLSELDAELSALERAEILRSSPASLRQPALILRLAGQEPPVAAAAIAAARLDDWQWSALIAELPLAARGHLRHRRDLGPRATAMLARFGIGDLGLPSPEVETDVLELGALGHIEQPEEVPARSDEALPPDGGIGAIVRRIEAFRRNRQAETRQFDEDAGEGTGDPRLPLIDPARAELAPRSATMRFTTDVGGRIVWADEGYAAAMVGMPFGSDDLLAPARCDRASARAIRQRRPLRRARFEIEGAPQVAGVWRADATPQFDPVGGRFIGYRGVLRRPSVAASEADNPADRLRQLLHELRTPINAIQGFAELIQQQVLGTTPHHYRSLAASIASDSAAILAGFDEIDILVRLETDQGRNHDGSADLKTVVERALENLAPSLSPRGVRFNFTAAADAQAALAEDTAESVVWRLLTAVAAAAAPGERLAIDLTASAETVELSFALPASLVTDDPAALFKVSPGNEGSPFAPGMLGGGFALRLAKAEARAAGGKLDLDESRLRLRLPAVSAENADNRWAPDLTPRTDPNSPFDVATAFSVRSGR